MVKILTRLVTAMIVSFFASAAIAGGGQGPGIVEIPKVDTSTSSYLKKRHKVGMEYALENDVFIELLEGAVVGIVLDQGKAAEVAVDIVKALHQEISRIKYAGKNGLDFRFAHTAVADLTETVLVSYMPEVKVPLTALKISAAFLTAYTFGFFYG